MSNMKKLTLKVEEESYETLLKFLQTLDYVTVSTSAEEVLSTSSARYDFSDLAGKLEWRGDAVEQQRLMRDEW